MQTRRQTLKQSAVVAGLLAGTGLFPQYALAFNKAAFEAKNLNDALKALGASGAPAAVVQAMAASALRRLWRPAACSSKATSPAGVRAVACQCSARQAALIKDTSAPSDCSLNNSCLRFYSGRHRHFLRHAAASWHRATAGAAAGAAGRNTRQCAPAPGC